MKRWTGTLSDRFEKHVERGPDCWLWTGRPMNNGYGKVTWQYQQMLAHRVAYELFVGPIPEGLQLDHLCRNKLCVNPEHLEPVTMYENLRRGRAARETCRNGHVLIENRYYTNQARCRLCERARNKRRIR